MKYKNKLFIISGPSGAGEDSVIEGLKKYLPIERVVTTTTRKKRSDIFAEDPYYFVSKEEFEKGVENGIFFEYAEEYNGKYYGVTKNEIKRVMECDKIGIWKIEYKGVMTAKKILPEVKSIFIMTPAIEDIERRLLKRGESPEYIKERMEYTKEWMKHREIYDHEVINYENKLEETIQKVKNIILNECNNKINNKMKKNINIVIMGPQGSGKGTQARLLLKKYNLQSLEVGDILRKIAKEDTEIGREVDEVINKKGQYASWKIVKKVFDQELEKLDKNRGILFDGTPRRMEEVEYWEKKLPELNRKFDYIFYVNISKEESVKRLSSRKLCEEHAHPLIVGVDLEEEDKLCPICGSKVYSREDDTPEKILRRLQINEEKLSPVIEYFDKKNMLTRINGEKSIEEVHKEILRHIEK